MAMAIQTQSLSKRYRSHTVLTNVTLNVPPGAVYALVGENGAGKTTLIKLLMNILQPTSGAGSVLGVPLNHVAGAAFEQIGYVSENQELPESMTVKAFLAYVRGFYPNWDRALEERLIRELALPRDRKLKHLSRGMKMKAVLISVLAYHPPLIVLDEPFSGLDPLVRDEVIRGLIALRHETTLFLSSHDLAEIEPLATHVGYLENGKLLFSEEMSALASRFREIEIEIAEAWKFSNFLPTWLQPVTTPSTLRFVDTQFTEATERDLAERFPNATRIAISPMSLKTIFLALARSAETTAA